MSKLRSAAADKMVDRVIPIEGGMSVALIDYMGTDYRVVEASAYSYGRLPSDSVEELTRRIDHLITNRHTTPFEHVHLTFDLTVPIMVARHIVRHRTANMNELSGRYTANSNAYYVPTVDRIISGLTGAKKDELISRAYTYDEDSDELIRKYALIVQTRMRELNNQNMRDYNEMREDFGIVKELARTNNNILAMTNFIWTIDLHNFLGFLRLRMGKPAQYETRVVANHMFELASLVVPITMERFKETAFTSNSIEYSDDDAVIIKRKIKQSEPEE